MAFSSNMPPSTYSVRARWVLPVRGAPIPGGSVCVEQARIREIHTGSVSEPMHEFSDAVILPALANAHTHLELTNQTQLRPDGATDFPQWLDQVIEFRKSERVSDSGPAAKSRIDAIASGLKQSHQSGTGQIADIASLPIDDAISAYHGARGICFAECLDARSESTSELEMEIARFSTNLQQLDTTLASGMSPHSPYTVSPQLLGHAVQCARKWNWPLAMHLAESEAEMTLLANANGKLVDVLAAHGAWQPERMLGRRTTLDILRQLAKAPRALVIHGNYLAPDDYELLAANRDQLAVVYCPRTHAAFPNRPYPLHAMLENKVRVLLGTDSLATNPSLSILEELAYCRHRQPSISPGKLIEMATVDYWDWAGIGATSGFVPGAEADFIVVSLPDPTDPYSFLQEPTPRVLWRNRNEIDESTG